MTPTGMRQGRAGRPTRWRWNGPPGSRSEVLVHPHSVLARGPREIKVAVERAGIVLVGEVGRVTGDRPAAVLPFDLRIEDVAILETVAKRGIFEQGRPLRADVPVIQP